MQYQLFVTVALAIVGCVVAQSEQEAALLAAIPEINQWDAQSIALMVRALNRAKVTPESSEEEIAAPLTSDFLFADGPGAKYAEEKNAGRTTSQAFDLVFVPELVIPCENVAKHIEGPAMRVESAGVATTDGRTDTWLTAAKYCRKLLGNINRFGDLCYKHAEEKNLL